MNEIKIISLRLMNDILYRKIKDLSEDQDMSLNMTVNLLLGYAFNQAEKEGKKFNKKIIFEAKEIHE